VALSERTAALFDDAIAEADWRQHEFLGASVFMRLFAIGTSFSAGYASPAR